MMRYGAKIIALSLVGILICGLPVILSSDESMVAETTEQRVVNVFEVTTDERIGSNTYDQIWIHGGALTIKKNTQVTVKDSLNITDEGSLKMEGGATLRVEMGIFDGSGAKKVEIRGTLEVTNHDSGDIDGESTFIVIETIEDITIENALINCFGGDGLESDGSGIGGDGGDASVSIRTSGTADIFIIDSEINVKGGRGGQSGREFGNTGGAGGDVSLEVEANDDLIIRGVERTAEINGIGGDGGPKINNGEMGSGGKILDSHFKASDDMVVERTSFLTKGGVGDTGYGTSNIKFEGNSIGFDEETNVEAKNGSLSSIISDVIDFKSKNTVKLHEVNVNPEKVQTLKKAVEFYWWLHVSLMDGAGIPISTVADPLGGVIITDETGNGNTNPTDQDGSVWLELLTRVIGDGDRDLRTFDITASYFGESTLRTGVTLKENDDVGLVMDLLDLKISNLWVAGTLRWGDGGPPSLDNAVVGDITLINGTSSPVDRESDIQQIISVELNIQLKMSDDVGNILDDDNWVIASRGDDGTFDNWYYQWNTANLIDMQEYVIIVKATDGTFTTFTSITVRVDQSSVNHPPQITSIDSPVDNFQIIDRSDDQITVIEGEAYDEDWNAPLLAAGRTIEHIFVDIILIKEGGEKESVKSYDAMLIKGEKGSYTWSLSWNSRELFNDGFLFPNGRYLIEVKAIDSGGLSSSGTGMRTRSVTLKHEVSPVADIAYVSCPNRALIYMDDQNDDTDDGEGRMDELEALTKEKRVVAYVPNDDDDDNRGIITLMFDAGTHPTSYEDVIGSYDDDGKVKNTQVADKERWDEDLTFFWRFKYRDAEITSDDIDGDGGNGWSEDPALMNTFEMDIENWDEDKRNNYLVTLVVRDEDGIESQDEI